MEQKKEIKNEKTIMLIFLILLTLIIIIFLIIQCLGEIHNTEKVPTGNIDIFDIIFGDMSQVIVQDDETIYSVNTPLRIFTHTSYKVVNNVIAPKSENSYQFVIRNNNNFNIEYDFKTQEENEYNINMKYRLKLNGIYVVGNDTEYVTAKELYQYDMLLGYNNYDVYTLEWKWYESENDTEIGTNINSKYKLNLEISATQY